MFLRDFLAACLPLDRFNLVSQFVQRDVAMRHRGSMLGWVWLVATPLLTLLIYTFVFGQIMGARWAAASTGGDFTLRLYSGLIAFGFFSEVILRAPKLIVDQPNLVKKTVFPLEILAWVAVGGGLVSLAVNFAVLCAVAAFLGQLQWAALAAPLVVVATLPMLLGAIWFLAALGVYVRDTAQVVGMGMTMLMFLSPVLYPVSAVPERFRAWLHLNPLTWPIESIRAAVLDGVLPQPGALAAYLAAGLAVAALGWAWFQATRKGFADVL
ncbi:ABC transporter permease [uncultured Xylophilus sp.]|uniref:ABC transporter permease n=1 Tax=uncultured Xylophilus sp. TaxID=296832 RepID=UPI0025D1B27F|nr:ABC transporter permease [uncultured Xylophilus sp.]